MENSFVSKVSLGLRNRVLEQSGFPWQILYLGGKTENRSQNIGREGILSRNAPLAGDYRRLSTVNVPNVRGTRRDSCIRRLPVPPPPPHLPCWVSSLFTLPAFCCCSYPLLVDSCRASFFNAAPTETRKRQEVSVNLYFIRLICNQNSVQYP